MYGYIKRKIVLNQLYYKKVLRDIKRIILILGK